MNAVRTILGVTSLIFACLNAAAAAPPPNGSWGQLATLSASAGSTPYDLGYSVAMSGNTIVTGATGDPAVYVYVRPAGGWTNMTQTATLTASDGSGLGPVAIDGNTIVAQGADNNIYVFVKPANGWTNTTETAALSSSDQAENLGLTLSISGNTVVAGSAGAQNGNGASAAYVFVRPEGGWVDMTETAELNPSDGGVPFSAAAVSGNTVVVGAFATTVGLNYAQGAAYVFVRPSGGWTNMTETAMLTASDGAAGDGLGTAVGISGGTIVAGAPGATIGSHQSQGATYVFVKPLGGWSTTTQTAKLTASNGVFNSELGGSVSISGNAVVAGAPYQPVGLSQLQGTMYVFKKPATGWENGTQNMRLVAPDGYLVRFGASVAISGNTTVGGAPGVNDGGSEQFGAMYVFGPAQSKNALVRQKK